MTLISNVCISSRVIVLSLRNPCLKVTKSLICPNNLHNNFTLSSNCKVFSRNMSQKSITSFFKITPKKEAEGSKDIKIEEESPSNENGSTTPITNGNKRSSKRTRSSSNESESNSPIKKKVSPPSEKKNKTKRLHIESSESESESPKSPEVKIKKEQTDTPVKTYESPKNKKMKVKVEKSPKSKSPKTTEKVKSETESKVLTEKSNNSEDNKNTKGDIKKENDEDMEKTSKVSETEYNPLKAKYHPIKDACWSKKEEVPYLALAKTLEAIEATSARLKMVEILSNYLRSVIALTPEDLLPSVYLCLNQLAPAYHSLELGIAETYLMKAIGQCTGQTLAQVKAAAHKTGDLGLVAEQARARQRTMFAPPPLKLRRVFAALKDIAHMTGQASVNKKIAKIQTLYTACRFSEAKYLIRSLEGKLRIGLAEQSVLQALALATATTPPHPQGATTMDAAKGLSQEVFKARVDEHALTIKTTYCECPDYGQVISAILQHGVAELPKHCSLRPGVPLKPMLAQPSKSLADVLQRFDREEFTCEWKYDGERAQIHVWQKDDGTQTAAVFSRNQEDNTSKYPDIIRRLPQLLSDDVQSCVLDCEAVAYDTANKQILPFQILSTRKRKDASEADIKVQVCVFLFDLLFLNGRALNNCDLQERRTLMREHFKITPGEWEFATSKDCSTPDEMQTFLEEAVKGSCEGLMVKSLRGDKSRYDIARRSRNWLKLKKDYLDGAGDSIDAVVVGAYMGRGKRSGAYGGFLLACYDPQNDEYCALCKLGTGFGEKELKDLTAALEPSLVDGPKPYYRYDEAVAPDAWFAPVAVWEVRCADLSLSPMHRAAIGLLHPDKGISLRFPRFIRVRDDKTPEQATSAQQLVDMYLAQDQIRNRPAQLEQADDFY